MFSSGIDQHKLFSIIVTINDDGVFVEQAEFKNNNFNILNYIVYPGNDHSATVETTGGWYRMNDFLHYHGIKLKLAHAKFISAM